MSARTKLETFEEVYNRKLTAAEAYANRPRKWMLYTLIVLIIAVMVGWSSSSIQFNGMTTTGSEVAKGVLHGVFNPDTALLFGTGDTDVPFAEFQKLTEKYHAIRFIASGSQHDFDRDTDSAQTKELLKETITFLHTLI